MRASGSLSHVAVVDAGSVSVSWRDRLFNLLFRWQASVSKCARGPLTLRSERTRSNWKYHQNPLKFPSLHFLDHRRFEAQFSSTPAKKSLKVHFFHLSIALSLILSSHSLLFAPLCLSSLVLLSTVCLSFTHAAHTTLSQSIQWNRAQTVDWDITRSPEGRSGRRGLGGGVSQIYNFIWISPVNRALGLHCSRAGPSVQRPITKPFYQKHLCSVVFSEHWVLLTHLVFLEDRSKWLKKKESTQQQKVHYIIWVFSYHPVGLSDTHSFCYNKGKANSCSSYTTSRLVITPIWTETADQEAN